MEKKLCSPHAIDLLNFIYPNKTFSKLFEFYIDDFQVMLGAVYGDREMIPQLVTPAGDRHDDSMKISYHESSNPEKVFKIEIGNTFWLYDASKQDFSNKTLQWLSVNHPDKTFLSLLGFQDAGLDQTLCFEITIRVIKAIIANEKEIEFHFNSPTGQFGVSITQIEIDDQGLVSFDLDAHDPDTSMGFGFSRYDIKLPLPDIYKNDFLKVEGL